VTGKIVAIGAFECACRTIAAMLLQPRWIVGHVLAAVTVVSFVGLGFWQLARHAEVGDLRQAVAEAQAMPIVAVEDADLYRRVVAVGVYDPSVETRVLRSQRGEAGYMLLTPLVLADGSAILVNRLWIPIDFETVDLTMADEEAMRPPEGEVRAEGFWWPAEQGSWLPDSLEPNQVVRRIDPAIVDPFTEYPFRDGYLIEALLREAQPPSIPAGPHLAYAVQWFLFAVIVVVGYPLLLRRATRRG
jgi:cytochrome oxidase assembly protein ShyY1